MRSPANLFLLGVMRSGTIFFRNLFSANRRIQVVGSEMNRFWTEVGCVPCGTVACCPSGSASDAVEVCDRVRRAFDLFYCRRIILCSLSIAATGRSATGMKPS
ncbi:MAG: hypothetical protein GXP58_10540 [Deltaproteobacteria bacterium]|nr:hypothetical protein [Deltaproteobacteria bacterium]